jgi:transcriptional regulator with XRE-family HTH domain
LSLAYQALISLYYSNIIVGYEANIDAAQLRRFLAANIKAGRKKQGLSQEKLAELSGLSVQTINCVEGCRTWVSDKTLVKLARALNVEVFQLVGPVIDETGEADALLAAQLAVRQLSILRDSIKNDIDGRFDKMLKTARNKRAHGLQEI